MVDCPECGEEFDNNQGLGNHLMHVHRVLSARERRELIADAREETGEEED